jgi:hypothetical protein
VDFVRCHRIKLIASVVIAIGVLWTTKHDENRLS